MKIALKFLNFQYKEKGGTSQITSSAVRVFVIIAGLEFHLGKGKIFILPKGTSIWSQWETFEEGQRSRPGQRRP